MGARTVAEQISILPHVSNVTYEYDSILQFDYKAALSLGAKTYKVYMPSRDDYEISIEVVDRAIESGASLIVYDNWIFPTISGRGHATEKGIKVYTFGNFLRLVRRCDEI